jgi:single-strand selective monofunctional uracil DNA glycosylase
LSADQKNLLAVSNHVRHRKGSNGQPDSRVAAESVARLIDAAQRLKGAVGRLRFSSPISHVYNPLDYAWACHDAYLRRFAAAPKRVVFLGMNPGPFGMVQTGVPFGEIKAVRDWLGLCAPVGKPQVEHLQRPIVGFECERSEVSGKRLWGLFAERFGQPEEFFKEHLVLNYCPLAFMEETGRNCTPDKLAGREKERLFEACDEHLREAVEALQPEWLIGVGDFARKRAELVFPVGRPKVGQILHPSPANPAANRAWAAVVTEQLENLGVWEKRPTA